MASPYPSSPLVGRKRRVDSEAQPQTPARRRKVNTSRVKQVLKRQGSGNSSTDGNKQHQKSSGTILLSSPTDVFDAPVVKVQVQVRAKQAKASGLPNLSPSLQLATKVDQQQPEEASEVEAEEEAEALTPRPAAAARRRPPQRPPLSRRRAVVVNRARFGVGIVRCRSWRLNGEDTETEDESPPTSPRNPSPRLSGASASIFPVSVFPVSVVQPSGCACLDEFGNSVGENLEEIAVLPIDPSQSCFDTSYGEDRWQIRPPSPDEEFEPEKSCCAGKIGEKGEHVHANELEHEHGRDVETSSVGSCSAKTT
ncbi:hypothetical protein ON010_g5277 [Phytophthora cinnamomi]|nr:hypothetical protein ON010_g5277 [Phytophthora cinnamomi]